MAENILQWDYFLDEDFSNSNMYLEGIIKSGYQW